MQFIPTTTNVRHLNKPTFEMYLYTHILSTDLQKWNLYAFNVVFPLIFMHFKASRTRSTSVRILLNMVPAIEITFGKSPPTFTSTTVICDRTRLEMVRLDEHSHAQVVPSKGSEDVLER